MRLSSSCVRKLHLLHAHGHSYIRLVSHCLNSHRSASLIRLIFSTCRDCRYADLVQPTTEQFLELRSQQEAGQASISIKHNFGDHGPAGLDCGTAVRSSSSVRPSGQHLNIEPEALQLTLEQLFDRLGAHLCKHSRHAAHSRSSRALAALISNLSLSPPQHTRTSWGLLHTIVKHFQLSRQSRCRNNCVVGMQARDQTHPYG